MAGPERFEPEEAAAERESRWQQFLRESSECQCKRPVKWRSYLSFWLCLTCGKLRYMGM